MTRKYDGSACPVCRHPSGHYPRCAEVGAMIEALRKVTGSVEAWQFQRGKPSLLRTALKKDVAALFTLAVDVRS